MALIDKLFDWEITAMTGFFHTVHSACNIIPTAFTPFMDLPIFMLIIPL